MKNLNFKHLFWMFFIFLMMPSWCLARQVDDWQFSPSVPAGMPGFSGALSLVLPLLIVFALAKISWLVFSVIFIATGKKEKKEDKMNPKRVMGLHMLLVPLAAAVLLGLSVLFSSHDFRLAWLFLIPPALMFLYNIWGIVYAVIKKVKIALIPLIAVPAVLVMVMIFGFYSLSSNLGQMTAGSGSGVTGLSGRSGGFSAMFESAIPSTAPMADSKLGLSVGGAKDVNNFRENIKNDFLPLPTDITYEGLFYDYYFETGEQQPCEALFCPSYSYAVSRDPISDKEGYYLSVGLNSNIQESDFQRKKLNLVVVLDVSGSMGSSFDSYYYDRFASPAAETKDLDAGKSKMQIASEAVVGLLDHLNEDDRFGMVLFDDQAYLAKPLRKVEETKMRDIKNHILDLREMGGTNMSAGMKEGTNLFDEYLGADQEEYENRIIFITDAMPNLGETSEDGLLGMSGSNAENKIYSTFIGVGVDFNTELIESISKIRGANYYAVHSSEEFKTRMDDEFEYMVTPLVFNLELKLDAQGYEIEKVYGSPEADEATGRIMKVNTLFPSKRIDERTRGGIVLLKLRKTSDDASLKISTSYEDRSGQQGGEDQEIVFADAEPDFYQNKGIRKAVLLARYADLIKNWINDERKAAGMEERDIPLNVEPSVSSEFGIAVPEIISLGQWERQSLPLHVSDEYKQLFFSFADYFQVEAKSIGDTELMREMEILEDLMKW